MSSEDSYTADFALVKPAAVTLDDYHRMLDRVDARLVGRGPVSDRPSDMSADAIWIVTTGDETVDDNTITRWDNTAGEWVTIGNDIGDVLGSESDPLEAVHATTLDGSEVSADTNADLPFRTGADITTGTSAEWFKLAHLSGAGASCNIIVSGIGGSGSPDGTGTVFATVKNGDATGEHGGFWFNIAPGGALGDADIGVVETGDLEADVYYKAPADTQASATVHNGDGATRAFEAVGTTEPSGIAYLDETLPVASPAEFAGGITNGLDVGGTIRQNTDAVATIPWTNRNTVQQKQSWDGTSLVLETGTGDTIEFISEN